VFAFANLGQLGVNSSAVRRLFRAGLAVAMVALLGLSSGCATYYQKQAKFSRAFESGKLDEAAGVLAKDTKGQTGKNKLLYYLNAGTVASLQGKYDESNKLLEEAYKLIEDYKMDPEREALALITNPGVTNYQAEDHEALLIHYYKALNYLKLNQREQALVECRRLNNKLNRLSDKYTSKNKYKRDAFINTLMGLIYDADDDYNNAFIAYRNAYNIYEEDYKELFGLSAPEQLKIDLIRAAYKNGFNDEGRTYEKKFGLKYQPDAPGTGEIVYIWNNGLGPVKSEWSINFTAVKGSGDGVLTLVNEQYGLSFSVPVPSDPKEKASLSKISFVRVAFPKYVERQTIYERAYVEVNGKQYNLQESEDINKIGFKVLQERFARDIGEGVVRLVLKQASAALLRKENEAAGAALSLLNAITEKADTRNWQTLPHSISYIRVRVPAGQQSLHFKAQARPGFKDDNQDFSYNVPTGGLIFHTYSSLGYAPGGF
jgi:uncharacterized protein